MLDFLNLTLQVSTFSILCLNPFSPLAEPHPSDCHCMKISSPVALSSHYECFVTTDRHGLFWQNGKAAARLLSHPVPVERDFKKSKFKISGKKMKIDRFIYKHTLGKATLLFDESCNLNISFP